MRSFQLTAFKCCSAGHLWRVIHDCVMRLALRPPHLQPGILRSVCCLKGLRNVEQILWALSAWAHSPLARLKSQGPARELTEFHMEARNRGTSCLSLTACPTLTLICRRPVLQFLSCLSGYVCLCDIRTVYRYACAVSVCVISFDVKFKSWTYCLIFPLFI